MVAKKIPAKATKRVAKKAAAKVVKPEEMTDEEFSEQTDPIVEAQLPDEKWGATAIVRCVNPQCKNHLQAEAVKLERQGNVYRIPFFHCAFCLTEMVFRHKVLREALSGG